MEKFTIKKLLFDKMSGIIDQLSEEIYVQVKHIEQKQLNDISHKFDEQIKQIALRDIKIASQSEENNNLFSKIAKLEEENRIIRTKLEEANLARMQAINQPKAQSILVIQQSPGGNGMNNAVLQQGAVIQAVNQTGQTVLTPVSMQNLQNNIQNMQNV